MPMSSREMPFSTSATTARCASRYSSNSPTIVFVISLPPFSGVCCLNETRPERECEAGRDRLAACRGVTSHAALFRLVGVAAHGVRIRAFDGNLFAEQLDALRLVLFGAPARDAQLLAHDQALLDDQHLFEH